MKMRAAELWQSFVSLTGRLGREAFDVLRRSEAARIARCQALNALVALRVRTQPPSARSAVVIAPHPDDETFGAGGMIALKRSLMAKVDVIFLTSGEASHNGCCEIDADEVARVRREEAVQAAACLALDAARLHWLDLDDGAIPSASSEGFREAVANLTRLLRQIMPQEVYCPHPVDAWSDHRAAGEIAQAAFDRYSPRCDLIFYLVWSWFSMSLETYSRLDWHNAWLLNIEPVFDSKLEAIKSYTSSTVPYCGNPYCGALPKGFLESFRWPRELFFSEPVVRAYRPIAAIPEAIRASRKPIAVGED